MKVVLVTTTFYNNIEEIRFGLAVKTVQQAKFYQIPIIIVDGSPNPDVCKILTQEGGMVEKGLYPGMGPSCREAIKYGLGKGADVIVWLEPEKYSIIHCLIPGYFFMKKRGLNILIPRRHNLDSYPDYQHWSELRANHELANITGRGDLDLMIGPRLYDREAAELTLKYDETYAQYGYKDNWEVLFIPILWALCAGLSVGCMIMDYIHPPEQEASEQGETWDRKRDQQRIDLIETMTKEAKRIGYRSSLA